MSDFHINNRIDIVSKNSEDTNKEMKYLTESLQTTLSDSDIRIYYNLKGLDGVSNMVEPFKIILTGFHERMTRDIESIEDLLLENNLTSKQIKILNQSKKLDSESLKIIEETQTFLQHVKDKVQDPDYKKLETIAYETVMKNKIKPTTPYEIEVIKQCVKKQQSKKGGLRKSNQKKNKTKKNKTKKNKSTKRM
jgi:hypothetical protein